MLRSRLLYASLGALSLASLGGALEVGCKSSTTPADNTPVTLKTPPTPPANGAMGDGPGHTYAVTRIFLGDTDRNGNDCNGRCWPDYGYDLDGQATDASSTNHCKPYMGAPPTVKQDGANGVDNSFGKNLVPLLKSFTPDPDGKINDTLKAGSFTLLVKIDKLGTGANYVGLPASLYVGSNLGHAPANDGSDAWPVVPELLQCADPMNCMKSDIPNSKVKFPSSFVNNNTWASGTSGTIDLQLSIAGYTIDLTIAKAVITMNLAGDRKSATGGIIAGVIPVEPLIQELAKVAGTISKGQLCPPSATFDSVANNIRQFADIGQDGGQDPSKTCDGISVGLGFEASEAQLGDVAKPAPPKPNPCMGAGGAGSSTASASSGAGGAGGAGGAKM